jgi:2-polyprenyl-3-methyl-5-hydroxy-6-metoxy-1,4-benzoquinol methylase
VNEVHRYFEFSKAWDKNDPKRIALKLINKGESVLDVGCSFGSFAVRLSEKGCSCDGIEYYGPAVDISRTIMRRVFEIDLNETIHLAKITTEYDVITFLDVLEHCIEPDQVIAGLKKNLKPNGRIIVSVPNIANLFNRLQILCGQFRYQEYGVMDKTHLRFFTRKTAKQLVKNHFKVAECIAFTPIHPVFKSIVRLFPGLLAMQIIVEGRIEQ